MTKARLRIRLLWLFVATAFIAVLLGAWRLERPKLSGSGAGFSVFGKEADIICDILHEHLKEVGYRPIPNNPRGRPAEPGRLWFYAKDESGIYIRVNYRPASNPRENALSANACVHRPHYPWENVDHVKEEWHDVNMSLRKWLNDVRTSGKL